MEDWLTNRMLDNILNRGWEEEAATTEDEVRTQDESVRIEETVELDGTEVENNVRNNGASATVAQPSDREDNPDTSLDKMEEVNVSPVLYKKKPLIKDDSSLKIPYTPLNGESPLYLGSTTDGTICLSDYRLYVSVNAFFNIPVGLIEQVECRDIYHLYIYCKDARTFRCTFSDNATCLKWFGRIQAQLTPKSSLEEYFPFRFLSWARDDRSPLYSELEQKKCDDYDFNQICDEVERMGFDEKHWRITDRENIDYGLCPTYPRHIVVPRAMSLEKLKEVAAFRHSRRIPAVVWRHKKNGCVIARCSQPKVGWFSSRSVEDEMLIQYIAEACIYDPGTEPRPADDQVLYSLPGVDTSEEVSLNGHNNLARKVLVIDARSYTAAVANRAKGGGSELSYYYPNCEILYQGLANIHAIRKSFQSLRTLCASPPDPATWQSSLESTCWLQYIASLIHSSLLVVNAIDVEHRPVLVHCSDGWDRTPQIVTLAELMMDPYYRSKKGFQVLVEREWLAFGHKFADRCGNGALTDDPNERSPVFLQWLDCVHQLLSQYPCHFEFNEQYLVKLVYHTYSCLFGTFLCNTDCARRTHSISVRTFSIWSHLNNNPVFHNSLYNESLEVLRPSCLAHNIKFWSQVYFPNSFLSSGILVNRTPPCSSSSLDENVEGASLVKTKSYDDISSLGHSSGRQRRSSDTNVADLPSFEKMEKNYATNFDLTPKVADAGENPESDQLNKQDYDCRTSRNDSISYQSEASGGESLVCITTDLVNEESSVTEESVIDSASYKTEQNENYISPRLQKHLFDLLVEVSSPGSCNNRHANAHTSPHLIGSTLLATSSEECTNSIFLRESDVPHVLDIDGSIINYDEIQVQVQKMENRFRAENENLKKQVETLTKIKDEIYRFLQEKNGIDVPDPMLTNQDCNSQD